MSEQAPQQDASADPRPPGDDSHGVVFPRVDGRRSTTSTGRAVVTDALAVVDSAGSFSARRETSWRSGYVPHFRRLVEAGLSSPEAWESIADGGLHSLHDRMRWAAADGQELPLRDLYAHAARGDLGPRTAYATEVVHGSGAPERELSVPLGGRRLTGDELHRQLDRWVDRGSVEPSFAEAIRRVMDNPDWLALPGRTAVVLGAGAEMGPLTSLLRWGADVAAVDLPRPDLWRRVLKDAGQRAGRLRLPVRDQGGDLARRAGADLLHDLPAVTDWVGGLGGSLVLGNYVYADGATNVRVAMAVDAMTLHLQQDHPDLALGFLATPTDVFAVPGDAVLASTERYRTAGVAKAVRVPLRTISGGRLLRRNYVPGEDPGINDSVVTQQGPNYLLAKRLQRWRATVARAEGSTVSFKVAPPTRTRSVVKNRALAAAYAGAHRFGIEVFEPATSNTLMAALLVHDLCADVPVHAHPWQDEAYAAAHGGLWRGAYDPRSALGIAALLGAAAAR